MRREFMRAMAAGFAMSSSLALVACGGGGSSASSAPSSAVTPVAAAATNVAAVVVDSGPSNDSVNTLYTSVTVCAPGSTTACQTIDNIQVDTGSYGLRILAPALTVTLPVSKASNGNSLAECTQFVDGYSWGPVASADIQVGGETASSVPVQVIGDSSFAAVPSACASTGTAEDTVAAFGANGILGIGVFAQDCGQSCASSTTNTFYYSCSQTGCSGTTAVLTAQVLNPVPLFAKDNNGTIIQLPSVAGPGTATVTGSLIFGIDTESNNASGTQTVIGLDPSSGEFSTLFNGQTLSNSFIDSGSNGFFFNDSALTDCPNTSTDSNFKGFYCPASTANLSATLQGVNNASATVNFSIGNAETIATNNPSFTAISVLGGTYTSSSTTFDWGLPFFYGRRVANAIEGATTSVGTGPYVAF
jgi:hypothetical protein